MIYSRATFKQTKFTASQVQVAKTPLASFQSNVSGLFIPEILAYIQATQSGTGDPSPSNPRAITGRSAVNVTRTGANLWDEQTEIGAYNNQGEKINYNVLRNKNVIMVKGLSSVYFYCGTTGVTARVVFYTEDMTCILSTPATTLNNVIAIPNNACYMSFNLDLNYGTTYNNDVSINYPSTDTAYHAYNGNTYTIAFGDTYYGGELDVTNGVLRVTHEIVDLGDLNWLYQSGNGTYFYAPLSTMKPVPNSTTLGNALCEQYAIVTASEFVNSPYPNNTFAVNNSASYPILIRNISYTDATAFKTAISGVQLVYELATPFTIQLSPQQIEQLLGQNNVFCSSGDVAVKYYTIN